MTCSCGGISRHGSEVGVFRVSVAITLLIHEPVDSDANPVQHHASGGMVEGQQSVGRHAVYGKLDASH